MRVCLRQCVRLPVCSKKPEQAESARYALARLRQLTSARDTFVWAQTAAEHAKVGGLGPLDLRHGLGDVCRQRSAGLGTGAWQNA